MSRSESAPANVPPPSRHRDLAQAGAAVFAIAVLIVATVHHVAAPIADAREAATTRIPEARLSSVSLPNWVSAHARRMTFEQTPAITSEPMVPTAPAEADGPSLVTASWYGPGFYENRLPCWQWLEANSLPIQLLPDTWGVAHRALPCGTMLTLTHGTNTVSVPVVDRGPYVTGRELDLSARVKAALGCTDLCTLAMQIP